MTDTVFILARELMHSIYNLNPPPFESKVWATEQDCVLRQVKHFGATDTFNVGANVTHKILIYEDIANMEAIRVVLQLAAKKGQNSQQLRNTLEYFINANCYNDRTTKIKTHQPVGITFNIAASQLPNFNSLYKCSPGDRMYTKPTEICQTMAIPQTIELYELQKN